MLNYLDAQATRVERESDLFKRLVLGVGKLALDKSLQAVTGDRLSLNEIIAVYADNARENANFINTFRAEFMELKGKILKKNTGNPAHRLVVFVSVAQGIHRASEDSRPQLGGNVRILTAQAVRYTHRYRLGGLLCRFNCNVLRRRGRRPSSGDASDRC